MNKAEIIQKINSIYATARAQSQYNFESRLNAAMKDKKFNELYTAQKMASIANIKNNTKESYLDYVSASKELLNYIENHNIDLEKHYICSDCKDTGFINGKACHCRQKLLASFLSAEANLPAFAKNTFDNTSFNNLPVKQAKVMTELSNICKQWANKLSTSNYEIVLICGGVGIGKSTLAFCTANEALNNCSSVYYSSAYDFAKMLVDKQFNRLDNTEKYYNMIDSDLLIIDDLGSESTNTLIVEQIFAILDSRINNNKKTMICSNLTFEQITKRYGERPASRLTSKAYSISMAYINGNDLRKIKC